MKQNNKQMSLAREGRGLWAVPGKGHREPSRVTEMFGSLIGVMIT